MARTIKEMAKEAVEIKRVEWSYKNMARGWYEEGANAVLDELKEYIYKMPLGTEDSPRKFAVLWIQSKILDKIKELKEK